MELQYRNIWKEEEKHLPAANWLDNDAQMHVWENASFDGNLLYDIVGRQVCVTSILKTIALRRELA